MVQRRKGIKTQWVVILCCFTLSSHAQSSAIPDSVRQKMAQLMPAKDTSVVVRKDSSISIKNKLPRPNFKPKKATLYGLIPGGGQVYNKQYWKVPFVIAGFGISAYFIKYFKNRYEDFVEPYKKCFDENTGMQIATKQSVYIRSQDTYKEYELDQIVRGKNFYKRYYDLNKFIIVGVWALSIVEANVSAHLLTFPSDKEMDELTLKIQPDAYILGNNGMIGAKLVLGYK